MKPFIIKMINDSLFVSLYAPFYVKYGPGRMNSTAAWLRQCASYVQQVLIN